jgi:hypothetical protein
MGKKAVFTRIEVLPHGKIIHKSLQLSVLRRKPAQDG